MTVLPTFETLNLAEAVEALAPEDVDRLPFGAIRIGEDGSVLVYNKTEALLSGYKKRPAKGRLFFIDVAPCMNTDYFKGRIDQSISRGGKLDMEFTFIGDFSDPTRELTVRVQDAAGGGYWIFNQRQLDEAD